MRDVLFEAGLHVTITVIREGTGPEVLLVHGGASPATTWSGLEHLSERWTLAYAYRRGFDPSPRPPGGRQDFELDAADVVELLGSRPHVVAHSYGALGALIAATLKPAQVRSLTLLEPALFLPVDDPEVARFRRLGDAVLAQGLETEPASLREFLKIAGAPVRDHGPLPEEVQRGLRRAHGSRSPGEARPALEVVRSHPGNRRPRRTSGRPRRCCRGSSPAFRRTSPAPRPRRCAARPPSFARGRRVSTTSSPRRPRFGSGRGSDPPAHR